VTVVYGPLVPFLGAPLKDCKTYHSFLRIVKEFYPSEVRRQPRKMTGVIRLGNNVLIRPCMVIIPDHI
jgi:hypothetical protein